MCTPMVTPSLGPAKNLQTDNPLYPASQVDLTHASIESSEMANIYSGNIVLDRRGQAVVDLPEWALGR